MPSQPTIHQHPSTHNLFDQKKWPFVLGIYSLGIALNHRPYGSYLQPPLRPFVRGSLHGGPLQALCGLLRFAFLRSDEGKTLRKRHQLTALGKMLKCGGWGGCRNNVCVYIHIYTHIISHYICIRMYVCVYVCMYVCMYVRMYVCMHVCMHVCMYAYVSK